MKRALGLLCAVFVLLTLMPSADASGRRMAYAKKTFDVAPNGGSKDGIVLCPAGTTVAGGGVSLSDGSMRLLRSATDNLGRWLGTALNPTPKKQSMTVYADCAKTARLPAGTQFYFVPFGASVAPNSTSDSSVACPAGKLITGGGYSVSASSTSLSIGASEPDQNSVPPRWHVHFQNFGNVTENPIIEAVCVDPTVTMTYPVGSADLTPTAPKVAVKCAKGSQVTGGGTDNPGMYNIRQTKPTGLRARPPGNGWAITLGDVVSTTTTNVTAACMSLS